MVRNYFKIKSISMALVVMAIGNLLPAVSEAMPNVRLGVRSQFVSNSIDLRSLANGTELSYRPASSNYFGVLAGYKMLGGTLYFAVPADDETRRIEGESEYSDIGFTFYFKNFGIEVNYNRYKGFLIDNSDTISAAARGGQTFFKLPNMLTEGYGATGLFSLSNSEFSLAAAFDQSEIQSKSAGAVLLLLTARRQRIDNPSAIIPTEKQTSFGVDQTIDSAKFLNTGAGLIYAYNWVPGAFFVSAFIGLSGAYEDLDWSLEDGTSKSDSSFTLNVHTRLGLGINTESFFLTVNALMDRYIQETDSIELANSVIQTTVSLGIRF